VDTLREVPGVGPYDAPLLLVGEGPGKNEVAKGEPFVGAVGMFMQQCFRLAGMPMDETRRNNAVPVRCPVPKTAKGKEALLQRWWESLDADLARMRPKVVVACGALAHLRLGGDGKILRAHGTVVPYNVRAGANEYETLLVSCMHPAGVMRGSKMQAGRLAIARVVVRAVRYARRELTYQPRTPELLVDLPPATLDNWLTAATEVVIDTEFDPTARQLLVVGLARPEDPWSVVSLSGAGLERCIPILRKHLQRDDLVKVAHYHTADVQALGWAGIDTAAPCFDTLAAFSTLYPDLKCGLSPVARFYLDDVHGDWKGMDKRDPLYNAIDVSVTARIYDHLRQDLSDTGMWDVIEEEVMPTLPLLYGLQERGLQVDRKRLQLVRIANRRKSRALRSRVCAQVEEVFERRRQPLTKQIEDGGWEVAQLERETIGVAHCEMHNEYKGLRKKKWMTNDKCKCATIYNDLLVAARRTRIAALRDQIRKATGKMERWSRGFDPDNNDHVRWLLYDKAGLGLPRQKSRKTGGTTADATAVARLLALKVTEKKGLRPLLRDIKLLQGAEKMYSTFLKPPMDRDGVVHPPYRMHGTGTGRPAGGDDDYLSEKGGNKYKFNALNIPREGVRRIYVAEEET
jgi:DNA polymerase